ncbi:MAG: GreA/GreB family elongation factor [Nitrososphaerales archaeon]
MSDERALPQYDPPPGVVALGAHVEVELISGDGDIERLAFDIVPEQAADFDAGFLAITTPLGRAIVGRSAGAEVSYRMGDVVRVRILSVRRSERRAEQDAAAEREAATRDAVQRAKTDETIQLALTFSSKWGDYDPEPLERGTRRLDDKDESDAGERGAETGAA